MAKLNRDFKAFILDAIALHLESSQMLANDLSLSNPKDPEEIEALRRLRRKILSSYAKANPDWVRNNVEDFVKQNIGAWLGVYNLKAEKLCRWVARNIASDVSATQRRLFVDAGFPAELLKKKWTIPVVGKAYFSPKAEQELEEIVKRNTELITKMAGRDVAKLQDVIAENYQSGKPYDEIRATLNGMDGFDDARAKRVALDQCNKINEGIQTANAQSLGLTQGIWVHVAGQYTSRESHIAMDGKTFDLDKGLYDPEVNKWVKCGELPFCRCVYRTLIPPELLGGNE